MSIDLHGSLAGFLSMATASDISAVETEFKNTPNLNNDNDPQNGKTVGERDLHNQQVKLVAGEVSQHYLQSEYTKALSEQGFDDDRQLKLVAGVGFEPTTFRL